MKAHGHCGCSLSLPMVDAEEALVAALSELKA
jgi:hypothetical protein